MISETKYRTIEDICASYSQMQRTVCHAPVTPEYRAHVVDLFTDLILQNRDALTRDEEQRDRGLYFGRPTQDACWKAAGAQAMQEWEENSALLRAWYRNALSAAGITQDDLYDYDERIEGEMEAHAVRREDEMRY